MTRQQLLIYLDLLFVFRGVATNSALEGPGSNRDLFCIVNGKAV